MHKQFKEKKKNFKSDQQQSILEKYGGEEHLDAPPKELLMAQTVWCNGGVAGDDIVITGELCRVRQIRYSDKGTRESSRQIKVSGGCVY